MSYYLKYKFEDLDMSIKCDIQIRVYEYEFDIECDNKLDGIVQCDCSVCVT